MISHLSKCETCGTKFERIGRSWTCEACHARLAAVVVPDISRRIELNDAFAGLNWQRKRADDPYHKKPTEKWVKRLSDRKSPIDK